MTAHLRAEVTAQGVFDVLHRAGARGLSFAEVMDETGYTACQVRYGMSYLRESLPELKGSNVFTYDIRDRVYRIVYIPDVAESYELIGIRSEATRSYRVLTGTVIPHAKHSSAKQLRIIKRHLELIVDEVEDILAPA